MKTVIKRDGREVPFDQEKIVVAIRKAFTEIDGEMNVRNEAIGYRIAETIADISLDKMSVEEIQDQVEVLLMQSDRPDVAKAYILYRDQRTKARDRKSRLVQTVLDRADMRINKRMNANVDEDSFSGREKEASSDIGKTIALEFDGLSTEAAKAHKEMLIYQHDLEKAIYGEHNCLFLNFQEIFTNGFHTRNGDVRPPTSFSTACQLVAVAFQCQSQVQFGGVGTIHLDYDLAPFVKMSFKKHIKNYYTDAVGLTEEQADAKMTHFDEIFGDVCLDNQSFKRRYEYAYKYAVKQLEREGKQAAQGLYHNLNTLESRQGSQVKMA